MKIAVISGITGQDGSFLAALLVSKGYKVIGLLAEGRSSDFFRLEYLGIKNQVEFKTINLLSSLQVSAFMAEHEPNEFYNLAALSSVGLSFKQPHLTFEFNTLSVMNILDSIRLVSSKTRFYQASSSEMFGNIGHSKLPVKESFLFHPVSPYGISKASAHWLTVNYREAYKLNTCCGILFNHESALRPDQFVIKKIINTAIRIKEGNETSLHLGNIAITRDWGYAPMYVDAMWRMMQQDAMSDYLICAGNPITLQGFVYKVFERLGLAANDYLKLDTGLLRSLDLDIIYGDNSKAKKELEWNYTLSTEDLVTLLIKDEYEFMEWKRLNII